MNKKKLAVKIDVSVATLYNWEKTKPELIRLINLALKDEVIENLQIFKFDCYSTNCNYKNSFEFPKQFLDLIIFYCDKVNKKKKQKNKWEVF